MAEWNVGAKNGIWKGGRSVASNGYVLVRVGVEHHLADVRGYAYEHRLVAEEKIGRRLRDDEHVHHVDGDKQMLSWDRRHTKRMLRLLSKDDGTPYRSVEEFRDALMDELAQGHEVIPMSKECEGFNYKTGCPGHKEAVADTVDVREVTNA